MLEFAHVNKTVFPFGGSGQFLIHQSTVSFSVVFCARDGFTKLIQLDLAVLSCSRVKGDRRLKSGAVSDPNMKHVRAFRASHPKQIYIHSDCNYSTRETVDIVLRSSLSLLLA